MSIRVTLEAKVKTDQFNNLKNFLEENLPNVRGFIGALHVSILYDEETGNFLIFEEWLSREHHQKYVEFISQNGVMQRLMSFMEEPLVIKYYSKLDM